LIGLKKLDLNRTLVGDAWLVSLSELSNLEKLYLDSTQVGSVGLMNLQDRSSLVELYLSRTQITSDHSLKTRFKFKKYR
jgi:hypothetical protein